MIKERVEATNGVLVGIDGVLEPPPSMGTSLTIGRISHRGLNHCLASTIPKNPSLSYFSRIKNTQVDRELDDLSGLTVFLPIDSAWDSLHPIERLYLESEFSADDLIEILHGHAVAERDVFWSESFDPGVNRKFSLLADCNAMFTTYSQNNYRKRPQDHHVS